jgi:hypothetical protein
MINFRATVTHYSSSVSSQFYVDGNTQYFTPAIAGGGNIGYNGVDTHVWAAGWHTFTVISTDAEGNVTRVDWNVYIGNAPPAGGYLAYGDLYQWYDEWISYRSAPPNYDNRWRTLALPYDPPSWWGAFGEGAGSFPMVHTPNNFDATHYQQRVRLHVNNAIEGGTDHNHIYMVFAIDGAEYTMSDNANGTGYWGLLNTYGGIGIQILRWCTDPTWNDSFTRGIYVYYDYVLKPGYQS